MIGNLSGPDLLWLASFVIVPIIGFWIAVRSGGTRARILLAAMLAGTVPGLLMPVMVLLSGEPVAVAGAMFAWPVFSALVGGAVGVAGLLLLEFRQWFAGRPDRAI